MPGNLSQDEWIQRVLGMSTVKPTTKKVPFVDQPLTISPPPKSGVQLGQGGGSGKKIQALSGVTQEFTGDGGRKIAVSKSSTGGVLFTSPPPPVKEICFSGGGAKGAALPGALRALQESGVLKGTTKIAGASVGSMTAALVAAGITAEEFAEVANADSTTATIVEGTGGTKLGMLAAMMKNRGSPLTGMGLEQVVSQTLDATTQKRIGEYLEGCKISGQQPDQTVLDTLDDLKQGKAGPTFKHLRALSKVIPQIKEVVITGTYTTEFETNDSGKETKLKDGNDRGQLYVFDADSEPDLPIGVAVHASASFPLAFKPVKIKLSSGLTVQFIDGGVMNNTPTTSSIGNERNLDPMPEGRGITFVFESEDKRTRLDKLFGRPGEEKDSSKLLKGEVQPEQGRFKDWLTGSDHLGAEYAKNRDMAERREEIVVVPLKITLPPKKRGGKGKTIDMTDGTLNFGLSMDGKLALQDATNNATNEQIEREKAPKTREFASDSQMFVSIPLADLKTLVASGYDGAQKAMVFRETVASELGKLHKLAQEQPPVIDAQKWLGNRKKEMVGILGVLDKLATDNVDFQGYIARELNKGGLDTFLERARKDGVKSDLMDATNLVSDALKVRTWSDNTLKQVVFPKMKTEKKGGAGIQTLLSMEQLLRAAKTADGYNRGIKVGIDHFMNKSDRAIPKRGHKQFAKNLQQRLMSA